jgi:hypothetical protein
MNKYILVLNGSRGMIEDVEVRESELNIEDFCNELYKEVLSEVYENVDEDEKESVDEYVGEFGLVSNMGDGSWEVGVSDEEWYSVYEIK